MVEISVAAISALADEAPAPPSPPALPADADGFAEAVLDLMPQGVAWPRDPDGTIGEIAAGIGLAMWRIDDRADGLTETEADPALTVELLPDWERVYGLPDPCTPLAATPAQRRAALAVKMQAQGGQSAAYFIAIAAAMGVAITIQTFLPAVAGRLRAGQPLYGPQWAFLWRVHAPLVAVTWFRAGVSRAGDPLRSGSNTELECRLRRIAPAHAVLQFLYGV